MFYELLYIVSGSLTDAEVDVVKKRVEALLTSAGATIARHASEGRLGLSYPIKKVKTGTYVLAYFEMPTAAVAKVEQSLRIDGDILRHMLLTSSEAQAKKPHEILAYSYPLAEQEDRQAASSHGHAAEPHHHVPAPARAVESTISTEELDKKLDEILESTDLDLKNV